ncbi:MAG: hypothetical protein HYX92_11470 [Chloroflexi bacterium]|nr:hypothetical protein [Chloroflexota bacterium]
MPGKHKKKRKRLVVHVPQAEIEGLLNQLDRRLLTGNVAGADPLFESLWKYRRHLPEVLTQRIIHGQAQVPAYAFELLGNFAGPRTPGFLKRIAESLDVADIVRFGARRRLGWPEEEDQARKRRAFLATLREPDETLVQAADEGTAFWPAGGEILQECLEYLQALPAERQKSVITLAMAQLGDRSVALLQAVVHIDDADCQLLALRELVRLQASSAAGAVERLAKTTTNNEIRAEAEASVRRLRLRLIDHREPEPEPEPLPPVDRVLLSNIDGDGGQAITIVRRSGEDAYALAHFYYNDHWGVKGVFGRDDEPSENFDAMVTRFKEDGIVLFDVELAVARGALNAAMEANASTGHPIPPTFEIWEPLLHDAYLATGGEHAVVPDLEDVSYMGRNDLLRSSDDLLDSELFDSWGFDPEEIQDALAATMRRSRSRTPAGRYRFLVEYLADGETCAAFRRRLRRQAWLLDRSGDATSRDVALAVAAQLGSGQRAELAKMPFLRALVQRSLDYAFDEVPPGNEMTTVSFGLDTIDEIAAWCLTSTELAGERKTAWRRFFGEDDARPVKYEAQMGTKLSRERRFAGWFMFDYVLPSGDKPAELAARRLYVDSERQEALTAVSGARCVYAQVSNLTGRSVFLTLENETFEVRAPVWEGRLRAHQVVLAHLVPVRDGYWLLAPGWIIWPISVGPGLRRSMKTFQIDPIEAERFLQGRTETPEGPEKHRSPQDGTLAEAENDRVGPGEGLCWPAYVRGRVAVLRPEVAGEA